MDILYRTDSSYVVLCHAVFEKPSGDVSILMEYMDLGTFESLLKTQGTLSVSKIANLARQVTNGFNYLHSHNIIHGDIKPANLLVNRNIDVKIADFRVSKIMGSTLLRSSTAFDPPILAYGSHIRTMMRSPAD